MVNTAMQMIYKSWLALASFLFVLILGHGAVVDSHA